MKALTAFIAAAARHLRAKAPASPAAPVAAPTSQPLAHCATTMISIDRNSTIHAPSPVLNLANPEHSERVLAVYRSPVVQKSAVEYKLALDRVVAKAAYRSAISVAIAFASEMNLGMSPEVVAEILGAMVESMDDEFNAARADHATFDQAEKAINDRHRPLKTAVSLLSTALHNERTVIDSRIDALKSPLAASIGGGARYASLKAAGLRDDQIASLGMPEAQETGAQIEAYRRRLAELDPQIARLLAFQKDPLHNVAPIVGIDPALDALIAALDGEKAVAA